MTNQRPARPALHLPAAHDLGAAVDEALAAVTAANDRLGQVMAVVTAAAVRDILTRCEPGAPFDAARVELVEDLGGDLYPTGRYWTAAGDVRTFTEAVGEVDAGNGLHDMSGWTAYPNDSTRDVWFDLCTELPDRHGQPAYALDLAKAATALA